MTMEQNSIVGENIQKFRVFLQALLIMALNQKFWKLDIPMDPALVGDWHCLPSKGSPKKIIVKLNRRNDICRILLNKNLKI